MPRKRSRLRADPGRPPGVLRIIAGHWRSRRLRLPADAALRPTPERVRETLFNWLAPRLAGARCLDVFAGSGALGLEALSRGAASCVFLEQSPTSARALRDTLALLEAQGADVLETDALGWLARAAGHHDLIFLDPPFDSPLLAEALGLIEARGLLAPAGRVYLEWPAGQPPALPGRLVLLREGRAGQVGFGLAGVKDAVDSRTIPP
ncbi:MAG: 16S rRNA (guanine(966)-N(2))-methyltransferase RsmD [Gammaproteobacteria bacterium]|nr:16S rRNA (guanine(966)-N(2))-methyltransferase RsmD [Gammaproteobacteria bacterium]TVQ49804.1 MAG: 16S rRNA (guanine(966)-N(2))-methyltransferase RsmD [Gammaproteobacteria bacterium]